jgi:hypothetical protein
VTRRRRAAWTARLAATSVGASPACVDRVDTDRVDSDRVDTDLVRTDRVDSDPVSAVPRGTCCIARA